MKLAAPALDRLVPDYIKRFEAYIPSKPDEELKKLYGCQVLFRLNNNENPLGPPRAAQEIIKGFPARKASEYPSGDAYYLRHQLGDRFGLHPDQFVVGNGANEVIAFAVKAFCQEGDNIVTADKTFAVYEWVTQFSGLEARLAPLKEYGFDEAAMRERIDERTKIIFICNPNNPTGTYWSRDRLIRFLEGVSGRQMVVVDEAYCEFVERPDFPDAMAMIAEYPNLVVFRTFSKMYGLAGLRIGYLAASREVADVIRRTCVVYSVNALAQQAAMAAIEDPKHVQRTRAHVAARKAELGSRLEGLGLPYLAGEGCFVMIRLPFSDTLAYRKLMSRGVMVRSMTGFRFPGWIRVSMGTREAMTAFVDALEEIIG